MNHGWYEGPEKWSTFNDFFARRLSSPDARPIAEKTNEAVVVSPADSAPQGVWIIDQNSRFVQPKGVRLKSANFNSANDIIGRGSAYAGEFANGVLTHTFLDVNDYHRFHFPVSGTIKEVRTILSDDARQAALPSGMKNFISMNWKIKYLAGSQLKPVPV